MRVIFILFALSMTACIPWPHRANVTPPMNGTVVNAGVPVTGLPIRIVEITAEASCSGRFVETVTSQQGAFSVAPVREWRGFIHMMAHRVFRYAVCAQGDQGWEHLGTFSGYTLVDSGPWWRSVVKCELSERPHPCVETQELE